MVIIPGNDDDQFSEKFNDVVRISYHSSKKKSSNFVISLVIVMVSDCNGVLVHTAPRNRREDSKLSVGLVC